jgi:hypothetical protein
MRTGRLRYDGLTATIEIEPTVVSLVKANDIRDQIDGNAESLCLKVDWQSGWDRVLGLLDQALLEIDCVPSAAVLDRIMQAGPDGFRQAEAHQAQCSWVGRRGDCHWRAAMRRQIVRHSLLLARWVAQASSGMNAAPRMGRKAA